MSSTNETPVELEDDWPDVDIPPGMMLVRVETTTEEAYLIAGPDSDYARDHWQDEGRRVAARRTIPQATSVSWEAKP
jgi:hypothetical protein